ncbi:hypothetical protein J3R82DRAFT_7191 [Butyriboletus roseoflavus]|nr:hypothetical protein J3R82DRAFT_7191 [Butyriboletus roseoflavus]
MQRTYQAYSPRGPPSLPSQQNKVILQREYREKEGECFSTLRDVIKDLTGEELRTRQEILRKGSISHGIPGPRMAADNFYFLPPVIDILWTATEIKKQDSVSAQASADYGTPSPTKPEDTAVGEYSGSTRSTCSSLSTGYFTQSSPWTQSWQSSAEFDAMFAHYGAHFDDQQHFMSGMDAAFNQASSSGYTEDWSLSQNF